MVFWRSRKKDDLKKSVAGDGLNGAERTLLGPDWQLKGRVYGKGQVVFQSAFEGELDIQGRVTVDSSAAIKGNFCAEAIQVRGSVEGCLTCSHMVTLENSGRFDGEMATPRLQMEAGARLNGTVTMGKTRQ